MISFPFSLYLLHTLPWNTLTMLFKFFKTRVYVKPDRKKMSVIDGLHTDHCEWLSSAFPK